MRIRCEYRERLEAETRALARGTYVLSFLRERSLLPENPHLVLGFADTLLKSLRGLSLRTGP